MFFTKKQTDGKGFRNACTQTDLVDMHSHILPCVDDGSESVQRSLEMLECSYDQGVRNIVATPHFYPDITNPSDFLDRRGRAVDAFVSAVSEQKAMGKKFPTVHLGAETAYFDGISRSPLMSEMCVPGTKLLLVEMPFERWGDSHIREMISLKAKGFRPVIAHYDRYCAYQEKGLLDRLLDGGIEIQLNAEAFLKFGTKRQALSMVSMGAVGFLGSDCHNMTTRMPNLASAAAVIEKSLGRACVEDLMAYSASELECADAIV